MHSRHILLIVVLSFFLPVACKKESTASGVCQRLQSGIAADNKEEVKSVINNFIEHLTSQTYTEENLNKLAGLINQQCVTTVTVICFDCIKTLPSQSEIRISYTGASGQFQKAIDISYNSMNKMVFRGMHD
ncbi:MAG TPA: hypothetical protein VIZ28_06135 [Chitinophagaceae bacterium]